MHWYEILVLIFYFLALGYLFLYSLGQLHLTLKYLKAKKTKSIKPPKLVEYPAVTIQLPVYNEKYVIKRLIDAVCRIDYPKNLLEIQVLDDSNDETTALAEERINHYKSQGIDIKLIQRPVRDNFKAGALAYGLDRAKGEFIAIFDADFLPPKDFLEKTIPYFAEKGIGMVQTRWGHINRDFSFFTKMQAFGLDAHFSVEQIGRNSVKSFINFNGTGGVWRKTCIETSGGWSADTLTEDLDLSYRAQLKGWQFKYLESVESPAELPILMPAIKSQQYRWNKGAAETSRKNLKKVYQQKLPFATKVHATFHLLNSSVFLMLLVVGILSLPLLLIKFNHPQLDLLFKIANLFLIGFFSIAYYFWVASKKAPFTTIKENFIKTFVSFMTVSMGLSLHNGIAVLEGFLGHKTPFIRTPKFNSSNDDAGNKDNSYVKYKLELSTFAELFLGFYFIAAMVLGVYLKDYGMFIFHAMLAIGFITVFYQSFRLIWHARE
ncbi:MAG: histidine kinase [Bacteroidetes bacterium]|nr:MAG: histidine kinase [Bacteroidota bacterium]